MIKRIRTQDLRIGMFVCDLNCDWLDHPFLRSRFLLRQDSQIASILAHGIQEVDIDTRLGLDCPHAPTRQEEIRRHEQELVQLARNSVAVPNRVALAEEWETASRIFRETQHIVTDTLSGVRQGQPLVLDALDEAVSEVAGSILRNPGALLSLSRIRDKDNYTYRHCIGVSALLINFCQLENPDARILHTVGMGGMLHDVGKMRIPGEILTKPGRLSDAEYAIMQTHVDEGIGILETMPCIDPIVIRIAGEHHERHDGSGYPQGAAGDRISRFGQMAAIVDVYDALTSDRCYHRGMAPTEALRRIYEWSRFYFSRPLVGVFLRTIGIYPVGSLVRLESGRLAVVTEHDSSNLLTPVVKVIADPKRGRMTPYRLDLSRPLGSGGGDAICGHEDGARLGIDPLEWLVGDPG
ncbi:HD-GYP domain-containing protein [Laribacter hongkongensis]|uniref:HD-GYP domain-containing protein n=1 Tax=Laribacter hongkongensis TaxID=168471 RepID=UPI001EFEA89F|nr:HD-GYP domain-containing protein [Laribacter hongkongensis]MCG9089974.1 HD-GYP domain-containing protein [Laribacter hongkongensis]